MATATSPRSISVIWENVFEIEQNGIITMYEVLYQPLETFNGTIRTQSIITPTAVMIVVLQDLEEYVSYTISVRAYTRVGAGNYSSGIIISTLEDGINQVSL